jgi:DNA-binding NarL/FixJ family response regulator
VSPGDNEHGDNEAAGASGAVRVMVVDDHPIWRDAAARTLSEAGYSVVATAGNAAQALRVAAATRPEVVLLDLNLPDQPGAQVTRQLLAALPGLRVLILSASGERQDVLDAVTAGASGYLLKSAEPAELTAAVRSTAAGRAVFTPGLAGLVLGEYRRLAQSGAPGQAGDGGDSANGPQAPQLTERETEVLRLVATGLTYPQIAQRLTLSPRTVQNHVQNTLSKLQLHNKAQLVRYALERGVKLE